MEIERIEIKGKDGIEKVLEIHYEKGDCTGCFNCPLRELYPDTDLVTKTIPCSILAQGRIISISGGRPFIDPWGIFFCSENKIISALEISSGDRVKFEVGEEFKRQRKFSLGDLITKVCPGRCVFMENTDKCTEEYRKCPGCLLDGLNLDS